MLILHSTIFDPNALVEVHTPGLGRDTITYEQPRNSARNPAPSVPKPKTDKAPAPTKPTTTADPDADPDAKPERTYSNGG